MTKGMLLLLSLMSILLSDSDGGDNTVGEKLADAVGPSGDGRENGIASATEGADDGIDANETLLLTVLLMLLMMLSLLFLCSFSASCTVKLYIL